MVAALPDYWTTGAYAPGASLKVAQASEAVKAANKALLSTLQQEYPLQIRVRIVHYSGCFYAHVTGWDTEGTRVQVCNEVTKKTSKWWAAQVELLDAGAKASP